MGDVISFITCQSENLCFYALKLPSTSILIQQWTGLNPAILIINAIFNSYDWQSSGFGATVLLRFGLHISDTVSSVTDCTFFFKKRKERKSYGPVYGLLDSFSNFECLLNLDREICLAKEINILILIMLIRFVMAVIKGID